MASPVKEAKQEAQARWPGAVVVGRSKGGIKHLHPDDFAAGMSPTDIGARNMIDTQVGGRGWHFGDDPFTEANEVDTAWVDADPADAPWQKKMVLADYNAYAFREATLGFDQGQLIEYVHPASGETVAFQPQQLQWTNDLDQISAVADPQAITATIDDDMLTWFGAYGSGIDFQWQTQTARMAKFVNIASLQNITQLITDEDDPYFGQYAPPEYIRDGGNPILRVELLFQKSAGVEIWVDGVLWDERGNNPQTTLSNVEFRLAGVPIWWFKAPKAWDENAEISPTMKLRRSGPNLFVEILTPWSWLETASYPVVVDVTIDYQVGASADDAKENDAGSVTINATFWIVNEPDEWHGFRWQGVTISDGVTIDTAYVEMYYYHANRDEPDVTIDFEDGLNPAAFTAGVGNTDVSERTGTTTTVNWADTDLGAPGFFGSAIELKTIIQELEDSYDYSGGEEMVCRVTQRTGASSTRDCGLNYWDADTAEAAKLHIEYTVAGGTILPQMMQQHGG